MQAIEQLQLFNTPDGSYYLCPKCLDKLVYGYTTIKTAMCTKCGWSPSCSVAA